MMLLDIEKVLHGLVEKEFSPEWFRSFSLISSTDIKDKII